MTFITNSITNANPGPALYSAIETAMLAQGWTLVDTVVIGSNTHKVLKSAAAGNSQNLDWFLDINYPTTGVSGGIRFFPMESYDAATHTATRGTFSGVSNTTIDATTYSRYGATASALESGWPNTTSYTGFSQALQTTAFTYNISVTRDRIIGQLSPTTGAIFFSGFFTPTSAFASNAGAALFPLIQANLTAGSATFSATTTASPASTTCALSRLPKAATASWSTCAAISGYQQAVGMEGQANVGASALTGRVTVNPLVIFATTNTTSVVAYPSSNAVDAAPIGTLDHVGFVRVNTSTQQRDTFTDGTDTWYVTAPNTAIALAFKAV